MQHIFHSHINLACSFALLLSIMLMQLPEQQTHYSRYTLDKWAERHLELDSATDSEQPESDTAAESSNSAGIVSYLYIAWTQHQGASDMAGIFVHERVLPHIIQKYGSGTAFGADAARFAPRPSAVQRSALLWDYAADVLSLAHQPGLSGTSINAP